jgi:DNA-binding CsgD family transcriptional regulator
MLKNSIWRQYNDENSFRELLAKYCRLSEIDLIEDDKALYNMLKAKLTKKELKLFAMDSAGMSDEAIKEEFSYSDDEIQKAKYKLYKKLKQDKVRLSFRAGGNDIGGYED